MFGRRYKKEIDRLESIIKCRDILIDRYKLVIDDLIIGGTKLNSEILELNNKIKTQELGSDTIKNFMEVVIQRDNANKEIVQLKNRIKKLCLLLKHTKK